MTHTIAVKAENLYKVFGRRPNEAVKRLAAGATRDDVASLGTAAVIDASFEVKKGEIFVVMGLSGSGKSTLIRMLNGLLDATSGTVTIAGKRVTGVVGKQLRDIRRTDVSMVFQHFALLPHRTVIDNVAYGLEIKGISRAERLERARKVVSLVGLDGWADSLPSELSGGMRQRVGLARALAADTEVLLMDEAFSALDPLIRREMQDELIELQARVNKTIVFVTHDLDEALKLGDRIAIMKDARVVQVGTAEEILTDPADEYVEAFIEGVDRASVLTAANIMQPVKETALLRDGPNTARTKMRRHGLSGMLVVDRERRVHGYVTAKSLGAQLEDPDAPRDRIDPERMEPAVVVDMHEPLQGVIGLASEASKPIGVIDERGRLRGVVVKGAILAALAQPGQTGNGGVVAGSGVAREEGAGV